MTQRLLSAGIVVLHCGTDGCRYLLLRSYRYWDFPKGLVEAGESPLQAALRETREETGLSELDFAWGDAFCATVPYGAGKVARYYLALSATDQLAPQANELLGRAEHQELRWFDYRQARIRLVARLLPVIDWAHALSGC